MKILELKDNELCDLINNRWTSSDSLWDTVTKTYDRNLRIVQNKPDWLMEIPKRKSKVRANRIQPDMEAVINSLIAEPAVPNIIPGRDTADSKELASLQEQYFKKKYEDRNGKEVIRMGLRNLYLSRLLVIKAYWDGSIDDFNARAVNPKNVRVSKYARNEEQAEFFIEKVKDNLYAVMKRFPAKAGELMKMHGYANEAAAFIQNPDIEYYEAWINDTVVMMYQNKILAKLRNPYWDWDGILINEREAEKLNSGEFETYQSRRTYMDNIRTKQGDRRANFMASAAASAAPQMPAPTMQQQPTSAQEALQQFQEQGQPQAEAVQESGGGNLPDSPTQDYPETFQQYFFNYWDKPRKPYIIATIFNNEDSPIGYTDMIELAAPLQEGVDKRKRDIDQNCELVNGVIKVDAETMDKSDAQQMLFEAKGIIWGKGVVKGVQREVGTPLPQMVYDDMIDSRNEIDNLMRASSAFRGVRQGTETKAGRLALINQSAMSLEELTQVTDFVLKELFGWFYQIAKVRYTEYHYAKVLGKDNALKIISLIQDDFENGTEVTIIPGKTLPQDKEFKYEQAQKDVAAGIISPVEYFEVAGYENPLQTAKSAVMYQLNPAMAVGITPEEMAKIAPPKQPESKPVSESLNYKDAPEDIRRQIEAQAGLEPSKLGGSAVSGSMIDHHIERAKKIKELMNPPQQSGMQGQAAPTLPSNMVQQ